MAESSNRHNKLLMTDLIISSNVIRGDWGNYKRVVRATHVPTRLSVSCSKWSSPHKNQACCIQYMRAAIEGLQEWRS